jgi:hypothetical protein
MAGKFSDFRRSRLAGRAHDPGGSTAVEVVAVARIEPVGCDSESGSSYFASTSAAAITWASAE